MAATTTIPLTVRVPESLIDIMLTAADAANGSLTDTNFSYKWEESQNYEEEGNKEARPWINYKVTGRFQSWTFIMFSNRQPVLRMELGYREFKDFLTSLKY